jgi:spermidine/putrescine transport system permease protein
VIQTQFGSALNWPLGSALSIVMLVIVLSIVSLVGPAGTHQHRR